MYLPIATLLYKAEIVFVPTQGPTRSHRQLCK